MSAIKQDWISMNGAFEDWWARTATEIDQRSKPIAKAAWEEAIRQERIGSVDLMPAYRKDGEPD